MEHTQNAEALDWRPGHDSGGEGGAVATAPAVEGTISRRIALPSGGWAELRDPKEIRAKHRKKVVDQLNMDRMRAGTAGVAFDMMEGLMIMMVEKWDIPYLPGIARPLDDVLSVEELTIPDYDVLSDALENARGVIFPSTATVDGAGTPGSPTRPGGD